ncbi:golgi uridine diphosphate-N- acetylglucosamine transporter [Entomophthora muscae]|uniref:Golgi uridine diphosphate-N- acetylglucosamine transporter n=1 Tax=Entomophthora muscae TaxID=34485 RepID=A0ACC2SZJ4_9FUNG|nr:golgi uridine diphosphate-N- acetylglucosamine transporter [Entomophthora muscae]
MASSPTDTTASQQIVGVGILTVALLMASFLGIVQEVTYSKYGKHWREGLFYTHVLSLPFFLLFFNDISAQINLYVSSSSAPLPGYVSIFLDSLGFKKLPKLMFYLLLNVGTQYFCVSGVQRLSSMSTALTLNLVLTIRKMISIVFSVVYFRQPVSVNFFVGTVLAFGGTFIYSMASIKSQPKETQASVGKKEN